MKRIALFLFAAVFCVLLCSCGSVIPSEYTVVQPHNGSQQQKSSTDAVIVENAEQMQDAVLSFVMNGTTHGTIQTSNYVGDAEQDAADAIYTVSRENPYGAYAVDYITQSCSLIVSYYEITVDISFRDIAQPLGTMPTAKAVADVKELIAAGIEQEATHITFLSSGLRTVDYVTLVREQYDAEPETVLLLPETAVSYYPEQGRSRIVELTLTYPAHEVSQAEMRQAVADTVDAASVYVRYRGSTQEKAELLFTYLQERFDYQAGTTVTPVYSALCEGIADSEGIAKSWQLLCDAAQIPCQTVCGSREGETYWWNIVTLDEQSFHVDILQDLMDGQMLTYRADSAMVGYYWDTKSVPACPGSFIPGSDGG